MIDILRRNGSDLINLFVVPLAIALLPWPVGFRLLKWFAYQDRSHPEAVELAWAAAQEYGGCADAADWKWRFRLLRLLERVDAWLILLRTARWWRKRIDVTGSWPSTAAPSVLLTYHWGGGQWVWRPLSEQGFDAHFLARRAEVRDLGGGRVALWFARVREFGMRRIGGRGPLFTGGSGAEIRNQLGAGRSVVGMLDLPAQPGQAALQEPLLNGQMRMPCGLARLAIAARAPVVLFSCAFDIDSGRRTLRIENLPVDCSLDCIGARYAKHLDECLRAESAFWQLWSLAPLMFVNAHDSSEAAPDCGTS